MLTPPKVLPNSHQSGSSGHVMVATKSGPPQFTISPLPYCHPFISFFRTITLLFIELFLFTLLFASFIHLFFHLVGYFHQLHTLHSYQWYTIPLFTSLIAQHTSPHSTVWRNHTPICIELPPTCSIATCIYIMHPVFCEWLFFVDCSIIKIKAKYRD